MNPCFQILQRSHRTVARLFSEFKSGDKNREGDVFKKIDTSGPIDKKMCYQGIRVQQDLPGRGQLEQVDRDIDGTELFGPSDLGEEEEETGEEL